MGIWEEVLALYDMLAPLDLVTPVAHTYAGVHIGVLLSDKGQLLAAMPLNERAEIPCTERSECRTSGIAPHPIHDNITYLSSWEGKESRHVAYMEQLRNYIRKVDDPLAQAVYRYISRGTIIQDLESLIDIAPVPRKGVTVAFSIYGMESTYNPLWEEYYVNSLPVNGVCGITGEPAYIPEVYPAYVRYPGDAAKLFQANYFRNAGLSDPFSSKNVKEWCSIPLSTPGYVTAQKIIHTLQCAIWQGAEKYKNAQKWAKKGK